MTTRGRSAPDGAVRRTGPLAGIRVIELAGIGPGPFAGMMLSDMGADVVRVDRPTLRRAGATGEPVPVLERGRRSIGIDLKSEAGTQLVLELVERADALIEPYRPGVAERLGVGPDACLERNPRLVYGRMTGWGQDGPLATTAGHDINYIALSGALHAMGRQGETPVPPLNLVADFGGGGMLLAYGIVCALLEARTSGQGQVVDAAMIDGAAALMAMFWGVRERERWNRPRGENMLDTGAWFYEVYETADGRHLAIGAIEPAFCAQMLERLGIDADALPDQLDTSAWPAMKERIAARVRTKTRDEWTRIFEGSDACCTPVLSMDEAVHHPHHVARGTFVEHDGRWQPAPAPRLSRTPGALTTGTPVMGGDAESVLAEWLGADAVRVEALRAAGVVR